MQIITKSVMLHYLIHLEEKLNPPSLMDKLILERMHAVISKYYPDSADAEETP